MRCSVWTVFWLNILPSMNSEIVSKTCIFIVTQHILMSLPLYFISPYVMSERGHRKYSFAYLFNPCKYCFVNMQRTATCEYRRQNVITTCRVCTQTCQHTPIANKSISPSSAVESIARYLGCHLSNHNRVRRTPRLLLLVIHYYVERDDVIILGIRTHCGVVL